MNKFERLFNQKTGINFDDFYNEQKPKLLFYLNRWTNDQTLSEDITNEAFIQCLKKVDKYDGKQSQIHTWLFTIAKNMTIKNWKDSQKLPTISMDKELSNNNATLDLFIPTTNNRSDEVRHILIKKKAKIIRDSIFNLPPKQEKYKTVLILREIDSMSYDEIASYLNLNLSTVKSQIKKGREIIKRNTEEALELVEQIGVDDFGV